MLCIHSRLKQFTEPHYFCTESNYCPNFKDQYNFILDDTFTHRTTLTLPFWGFQLPFAAGVCLCPAFFWGGFKFAKDNFPIFPQDCWEIPRIHNSQELKMIDEYCPCMKSLPICHPSNVNTGEMLIHLLWFNIKEEPYMPVPGVSKTQCHGNSHWLSRDFNY